MAAASITAVVAGRVVGRCGGRAWAGAGEWSGMLFADMDLLLMAFLSSACFASASGFRVWGLGHVPLVSRE